MADKPQWLIREDAGIPVLVALALHQTLGVRAPEGLPSLRNLAVRDPNAADATPAVEAQWQEYWNMTVEPRAHPSEVPLELVDGFDTLIALPATGAEELADAIAPHASWAVSYARTAHGRYISSMKSSIGGGSAPMRA